MNFARRVLTSALLVVGPMAAWLIVTSPDVQGADTECLGATATIVGDQDANPGDGVINGTDGADVILGTEGVDKIDGHLGDDRICGLGGDDSLVGGEGFDRLNGGPNNDSCEAERVVNCEVVAGGSAPPAAQQP